MLKFSLSKVNVVKPSLRLYSDVAHKYSDSVFLPQTTFSSRSDPKLIENVLKPQTTTKLYDWNTNRALVDGDINKMFILHDGPPYSNGDLHIGHALNKVLKDTINRFELLQGKKVTYIPGWDCHGLPIELKALEKLGKERKEKEKSIKKEMKKLSSDKSSKEYIELETELQTLKSTKLSPMDIIRLSSEHAKSTQKSQSKSFQDLAIMGDFQNPYLTLNKSFVVDQLKVFKKFFDNGLIRRQNKPVYWGCENASALAEGELEYNQNHVSKTAFVKFPLQTISPALREKLGDIKNVSALIWTSTPWTLASNLAISINKDFEYTVLKHDTFGNLIVGKDLVESIKNLDPGHYQETNVYFFGSDLLGSTYHSPILNNGNQYPFLHGTHVTSSAGTGLVHTAPGHGQDDYLVCLKNGILPFSPVDQYGKYTNELAPNLQDFVGLRVLGEGNEMMISKIEELDILVHRNDNYVHSYPYDWRSKKPIIIRATSQWFIDVSQIKDKTTEALVKNVEFYPEKGSKRLISFINTRNEWCISRQRSWGVPIPVLYHKESGEPLLDDEVIERIIKVINEEDIIEWSNPDSPMEKWLPEQYHDRSDQFIRGKDTMDVWFDSGSSWNVILNYLGEQGLADQIESRGYISDIYLEGSDQHRGWFQSSILTKVGTNSTKKLVLPYKKIITHGFTLDEKGEKMSKSLGNTISPADILNGNKANQIPQLGIDGLRLWVAQSDYSSDISVGPTVLKHVGDNLKKLRFTFRFLLGNLHETEAQIQYKKLGGLDQYILSKLTTLEADCKVGFQTYNFAKVIKSVNHFINVTLSSIYFDVRKDCLYTDSIDSPKRQATLTVFKEILKTLTSIMGPILPIMTQEVWNNSPKYISKDMESNFQAGWYTSVGGYNEKVEDEFTELLKFRDQIKCTMDKAVRNDKNVKNSLETGITLVSKKHSLISKLLVKHQNDIADLLVVSDFDVVSNPESLLVGVKYKYEIELDENNSVILRPAKGEKCPRCWKFTKEPELELCHRCNDVIN